jgi:hypothetical protein
MVRLLLILKACVTCNIFFIFFVWPFARQECMGSAKADACTGRATRHADKLRYSKLMVIRTCIINSWVMDEHCRTRPQKESFSMEM